MAQPLQTFHVPQLRILPGGIMKIIASKVIQNMKNTPVYLFLQRHIKLIMERFQTDSEKSLS